MSNAGKFLSIFFNSGQKSIDPSNFRVSQFDEAQTAADAIALLKFSVETKNDEYIKSALNMIYRLYHQDGSKTMAVQLGDLGICALIDNIFGQKLNDIQLCNNCLQVMHILMVSPNSENSLILTTQSQRKSSSDATTSASASSSLFSGLSMEHSSMRSLSGVVSSLTAGDSSANRKRLSSSGTIFRIIKCGQVHINEVYLLLSVLKVIREFIVDAGTINRLVSCGLCDLLTQMLRQHTLNETILPIICELIYQVILTDLDECDGGNQCQDKFAEFYVCEQLTNKILLNSTLLTNISVVWVLKAVGSMARRHEENKKRFAATDTCIIIASLSQQRSIDDSLIAEAICWAIGNLAFPNEANQLQLGSQGSCEIILNILKAHSQNRLVVQEGMRALRNLCQSCNFNIQKTVELQGASYCMELLKLFSKEPDVLQWIMYSIASMCDYEAARFDFGQLKITDEVARIFHHYSSSANEDVIQWTSLVTANLASDPVLAAELYDLNVCNDLIQSIANFGKNSDVVEEVLSVISAIALVSDKARVAFIESSVHDLLLKTLLEYEQQESTVEQVILAFSSILFLPQETIDVTPNDSMLCIHSFQADDRAVNNVKLAKFYRHFIDGCLRNSGLKVLARVISKNSDNEYIALRGVHCLCGLALGSFLIDRSDIVQSDRILSVLRVGLVSSNKGSLGVLGDAGVISALCSVLAAHLTDTTIVKWGLYSILQLCSIERNMEIFRQTHICLILSKLLEIYYLATEATDILVLIFEIVVQLCIFADLRNQLGNYFTPGADGTLPTHSLLTALAHHLLSIDALRAGSEAMSALCISPLEDALSAVYKQDQSERRKSSGGPRSSFSGMAISMTGVPSTPSLSNVSTSHEGDSLDWIKFQGDKLEAADSALKLGEENNRPSPTRNIFGFASFFRNSNKESNEGREVRGNDAGGSADRRRSTTIATIDSYNSLPIMQNNSMLFEAASNIISTGLSDQEEMMIAQRAKSKVRKSSGESLVENGAVAMLVAALQSHPTHEGVLCSILNTLNSLAVFPVNRQKFDDPLIYEVLVLVLKSFTVDQFTKPDPLVEQLSNNSSPLAAVSTVEEDNVLSGRVLSSKTMQSHLEASRAVRILLLVVIGTICMPVADEETQHTTKSHRKNLATNAYSFHEVNQGQFGRLGIADILVFMLSHYGYDSLICEALLRAIYYLVKGNLSNQSKFSAVGSGSTTTEPTTENVGREEQTSTGIALVIEILRQNFDKPRVIYYACIAISAIAGNHKENASTMGRLLICELITQVLQQYVDKAEIVQACCQVIFHLKTLNVEWSHYQTCELVLRSLTTHANNATVAEWVCRAIGSLAEYNQNKIDLDQHQVSKIVTMALQKHVSTDNLLFSAFTKDHSSPGVARWGCTAIYYLAKGSDSGILQQSLVSAGACEAVAKALVKYAEVESVSHACCRALVVLLINNELYKTKLGGLGVCSCVVESLHLFPASAQVSKWGCRAVAVLAESNESNIGKLAISGACETIPLVLQAHPHNEHVATAGCDVISYMSEQLSNGYAARFGHAGACEAVVSVLRKHSGSARVVARASIALASLARVPGNARWFGPAGAADALYTVLCLHKTDKNVAKYIVSAVGNLCLVEHNKGRLGALGVCEELLLTAKHHQKDLDTAISAAAAIWKLCETIHKNKPLKQSASKEIIAGSVTLEGGEYKQTGEAVGDGQQPFHHGESSANEIDELEKTRQSRIQHSSHYQEGRRNRAILLDGKVCQTLINLLNFHLADVMAAETICHAISVLATPGAACAAEREQFGELGVCEAIVKAVSFHEGSEDVTRWGCLAVRALCHQSSLNQQRFSETQFPSLLVLSLRGFRHSVDIPNHQGLMEAVLGAVINLANNHQHNKVLLGEYGVCEGLLELLDLHIRNQGIIYLTVKALFHICDGNQLNRMKISFSGAADFLMNCLTKYPEEDKMVDFILATMIGMCFDKVGQSRLGSVGMCKYIVTLINKYEKASEYLALLSVTLVGILANNSKANQEKLGVNQIHKVIVPILQKALQTALTAAATAAAGAADNPFSPNNNATGSGFLSKTLKTIRRTSLLGVDSNNNNNNNNSTLNLPAAQLAAGNLVSVSSVLQSRSDDHSPVISASDSFEGIAAKKRESKDDAIYDASLQQPPDALKEEIAVINDNNANANVTLTDYIGESSMMKECCRSIYYITFDHDGNRQKFVASSNLIESLTAIISGSNDEIFSAEAKSWAKKAMDSLLSHS